MNPQMLMQLLQALGQQGEASPAMGGPAPAMSMQGGGQPPMGAATSAMNAMQQPRQGWPDLIGAHQMRQQRMDMMNKRPPMGSPMGNPMGGARY